MASEHNMANCLEDFDHNDDDLSEESASVVSDSEDFFRQRVPDDASIDSYDRYLTRHEFIHWIRNEEDPISILLTGTRHQNSPLSLLRGLEDTVLENILTFAVSPCNCCRDGPVAFCCRRQKKCVIDKNKEPRFVDVEGEVPDEFFLYENVLMYQEGLPGGTHESGGISPGESSMRCGYVSHYTTLVVTDTGFFYDYYDGIDNDYDNDIDYKAFFEERKVWFELSKSTRVLITSKKFPNCLTVELITNMFKGSEHPDFLWRRRTIYLPAARIREFSHLIQEKRRAVLDSSEYKEMVEYITRNDGDFRRKHYD